MLIKEIKALIGTQSLWLVLVVLFLIPYSGFSQSKTNDVLNKAKAQYTAKQYVSALKTLNATPKNTNPKLAIEVEVLKAKSNIQLENLNQAIANYNTAKIIAQKNNYESIVAMCNDALTDLYIEINEFDKAEKVKLEALKIYKNLGDTDKFNYAFNGLARLYLSQGNYEKSAKIYLQVLKNLPGNASDKSYGIAYANIGLAYDYAGINAEALKYYNEAIRYRLNAKDTLGLIRTYNNLGIVNKNANRLAEAEKAYQKAIELSLKIGREASTINTLINLGVLNRIKGNIPVATNYYSEALALAQKYKNPNQIYTIKNNLGFLYYKEKQFGKADPLLKDAVDFAEEKGTLEDKVEYWYIYALNLAALNRLEESVKAFDTNRIYADSLYRNNSNKALAEMSIKYQTEKREQENKLLKANNSIQSLSIFNQDLEIKGKNLFIKNQDLEISEKKTLIKSKILENQEKEQTIKILNQETKIKDLEIKQKNVFLFAAGLVLLFGILVGYFIINKRKLKAKALLQSEIIKQQDIATKSVLEAEERERRRIAGDLHDGVGQLLSVSLLNYNNFLSEVKGGLSGNAKLNAERVSALMTESYDEVRSISHQMMPNALLKAGLSSAIREFISKIDSQKLKITLSIDGITERLDMQIETVLYRVIQELVNNVIKHANANLLSIQLFKDADGIALTIEDNGVGFDAKTSKNGIGLENIKTRIALIKGELEYDTEVGKGTLVNIFIPS